MKEYKNVRTMKINGKEIIFFLKEGEELTYENIVDIEIVASEPADWSEKR